MSNLPLGAENDKSAPYNETSKPKESFDVTIYQTLSRDVELETDKYTFDEDGYNLDDIDWDSEMLKQRHYTPIELLHMFRKYLENDKAKHKYIIDECLAWEEIKTQYETY